MGRSLKGQTLECQSLKEKSLNLELYSWDVWYQLGILRFTVAVVKSWV